MAHGNPIYYICKECKQYILNPRFGLPPVCKCGKEAKQIPRTTLKELLGISIFGKQLSTSFSKWTKY